MHPTLSDTMQRCIEICNRCHDVCLQTVQHCLRTGGRHAAPEHVRLLLDCIDICRVSADFMLRQSPHHRLTCRACAEVCLQCATSCDQMGDDPVMQECARVCRECATSCRQMAGAE